MPNEKPNEQIDTLKMSDRKRLAILEAAIIEFGEQGFEATSMDKVAQLADVSKRTVYNHFASKEELFTESMSHLWEKSASQLSLEYDPDAPVREQLEKLLWQKMRMLSNPTFIRLARVAIAETIHSPQRAGDMLARLSKREEGLSVWMRAATEDKKLQVDDVAFASHQLQALIKSFAFWPQVTLSQPVLNDEEQKKVLNSALDMFLAAYAV